MGGVKIKGGYCKLPASGHAVHLSSIMQTEWTVHKKQPAQFQTQNLSNSIKYLQQLKSINLEWQHTSSLICFIYELLVSGLTF